MANGTNVAVNLTFTADTGKVRSQLQDLSQQLQKITSSTVSRDGIFKGFSSEINEATKAATQLQAQLQSCTNVNTGKLDLTKFTQQLQQGGIKLSDYANKLSALGPAGEKAFSALAQAIGNAEIPLRKSSGMLANFAANLKKVAQWQISSSVIHGFMSSLQSAYGYAQDLNASLNDIRIVTGQSVAQMDAFAKKANEAAKSLSTTTNNYAKASLIFYQQGLGDADVKARTDAVMKMVNVTKDSAEQVSSYMTAIWNNFDDGTKSLEHYADVMTALGAATASSTAEIAAGLEKFASIGDTIGLSYEYATSALATIVSQTRQSSEVVGNGLRTIFSRLQGLKLGETLDDGVSLNKYSQALSNVGVQILDAAGNMKNMDTILDELASKWTKLSKAQQTALAQTVGGVRQYTTLISLMDNWKSMEQNLMTAENSSGSLQAQQDIYAESWKAAADEVRAAWEGVWQVMVDDDFFISMLNGIEKVITGVHTLIDSMGGLKGVMSGIGILVTSIFGKDMIASIDRFATSLQYKANGGNNAAIQTKIDANNAMMSMHRDSGRAGGAMSADGYKIQGEAQNLLIANAEKMNAAEQKNAQILLEQIQARTQLLVAAGEQAEKEERIAEKSKTTINNLLEMTSTKDMLSQKDIGLSAESLQNHLNTLTQLQNQYSALAPSVNSIGAILDSSFGKPSEKIQAITQHMSELEKKFADMGGAPEHVAQAMDKLNAALKSGDFKAITAAYGDLSKAMTQMEVDITKTENALLALKNIDIDKIAKSPEQKAAYQELIKAIDDYIAAERRKAAALQDGAHHQSEAEAALERYKQLLNNLKTTTKTFGEAVVGTMRGISSIIMGLNSLSSIKDTLSDDSLSGWQKFSKVLLSVSMGLPMLISGFKALNLAALKAGAAGVAASIGQLAYAGAGKVVTAVLGAQTAAQWGLNAAITASPIGWFFGILAGAAAILAGVTAGIVALHNALNAPTDAEVELQKATKAAEDLADSYEQAKQSYNDLMSDVGEYESVVEQLAQCTAGTKEWRDLTVELDGVITNLITKYPQLAQYGKNIAEGIAVLKEEAELNQLTTQLALGHATVQKQIATTNQTTESNYQAAGISIPSTEQYADFSYYDPKRTAYLNILKTEGSIDERYSMTTLGNVDHVMYGLLASNVRQNDELWTQYLDFYNSGEVGKAVKGAQAYVFGKLLEQELWLDQESGTRVSGTSIFTDLYGEPLYDIDDPPGELLTPEALKREMPDVNEDIAEAYAALYEYSMYTAIDILSEDLTHSSAGSPVVVSYNGYTDYYHREQNIADDINARTQSGYAYTIAQDVYGSLLNDDNAYLGEVAGNLLMAKAVEAAATYSDKSARDIIKDGLGGTYVSDKDGVYTYRDSLGEERTATIDSLRSQAGWRTALTQQDEIWSQAIANMNAIVNNPIMQKFITNRNFDTATSKELETIFGTGPITTEGVQNSLLQQFGYTDINQLAKDLGYVGENGGQQLVTEISSLINAAFEAPKEAVNRLQSNLQNNSEFIDQIEQMMEGTGKNLTLGQISAIPTVLNDVNSLMGESGAQSLLNILGGLSEEELPKVLNALSSMDWTNIQSVDDLNSALLQQNVSVQGLGNNWITFAEDLIKAKKNISSILPTVSDLGAALQLTGSKAGETITQEQYDTLKRMGVLIDNFATLNANGEYVFFQDFMPNLAETVKNANELSILLDSISETASLGAIDIQTPEGLSSFTEFLNGEPGKDLLSRLGISVKDEDYANQDYMAALYSKIINLLNTNVGYDENAMKSMVYTSAASETELLQMAKTFGDIEATATDFSSIDISSNTPLAKALALIKNSTEGATESFNALTTSATTAISIMSNLSFGSSLSAENYAKLMDQNAALANSFIQLADGSYRFIGTSKNIDAEIAALIQSYKEIDGATIKSGFGSEANLTTYAGLTDTSSADYKALALAGYTPGEVKSLMESKDKKAIAAFEVAMAQVFKTAEDPGQLAATMATSVKQLGSFVTKYGLDKTDVVNQGQYLMSQATTLTELKAMQKSLTDDEAFESLGITQEDLSSGYVAGLLAIASGYASCKDEVQAYYAALATESADDDNVAKQNLETAITLEDLATKYNTTTEAIKAYKGIAGTTISDEDAAKAIAKAQSINSLNESYTNYVKLGNKIKEIDGQDDLAFLKTDSKSFESFVQAQKQFTSALGVDVTEAQTADLLQALDNQTAFTALLTDQNGPFNKSAEDAKALWDALTHVEPDPFQEATDALSQAATKLANDLEKAKTKAENAKTVFEEMINVLSDKDAKKSMSYLEGLRDLGLSSTSSSSDIAKKYLDLQKEAIFKTKLDLDNILNEDKTAFADSAISLDSIINLTDTKQLSAKLKEVFEDDNIANVAKEYFDTLYSETGSYTSGTVEGLIGYLKSHNQDLNEEWENFISKFVDSLTTAAQAQLQIEQETAQETANAWIKAYQAINDAREGLAKGTSIIETLRGDTEALEAFITTALNAGKNADQILAALASSSSTDWVESMTPTWSLKTQATGADITSQFLFDKDGNYKGANGEALVNYTNWAKSVDDWVDTAFTSVDQLTNEQKATYGITDEMVSDINTVKTRIKEYYRGTDGTDEKPTEEYRNAQAAIIAAEGQHTWDELESKMTIAKNTRDTAMAKAETEAKKNASIAKAVQALIDRDEDSDETLKEIISSSGATQEEFIALINEKYKDTGKQYTIDTVEAAIASGEIDLAEVLTEAETKRDTAYGEATTAATTYAEKFDGEGELAKLAGTQYEIEADSTARTATLNQEAGAITGGKEAEKTVDAFTAQIDKLKMDAADLADEMSTLNSIDITKMPKDATKAYITLSNALGRAGKDISTYTTEVQRAQMLADAQTQIMKEQSQTIKDQMSQYESKYSFNSSMTSADLLTITDQDKYQALQTYLGLIDEKEKIDAQADEIEAKRIDNQTKAYNNQYTALENRLKNLQANAEKTKTKADTLSGAIGSGQLTDTQRRMFSEAELTQWDGASTAAERAAIAAKTFSSYATEASNAATEMNGIYGDIKQKVSSTGTTAISDKDTLLQKLKDENKLSEDAIGTMGKAWDRLTAKGDLNITMSDLLAEVGVMEEELKASSDAATDYAADQIINTYTSLSTQNIAAAKAAADAWKTAFQEIAAARDKLLKGEDILSDVASNPEKLLNYFNNSTYSDMNTMVSDIISGKLTAKQLSTPAFTLDNFLAQYGLNMSSGEKGFGRSSVTDDKAMARAALTAQGLEVSDTAVEAYVKSYYKQILRANDKSLTDDQLTIQANELYKGTRDYNSFATSSNNLVNSITLAFTQLQTALTQRTEAESALTGALKTDRAKYTQFNGKQVDAETLNKIDTAISNADQLKADGKKWSDLGAADRALLESYGITGFDDLSSQALGCANALAALSGAALSLAKETAQNHGFYKNADGVYETVVDGEGNVVTTGAFNADGTLKEGYKWSGNKNQGLTDQINTLQDNADTATYNASDAGSIEALYGTDARLAGFDDAADQTNFIDYATQAGKLHDLTEIMDAYNVESKEAEKIQRKLANTMKKREVALKKAIDQGEELVKTANSETAAYDDRKDAIVALRSMYEDVLGPMDKVSDEFVKNTTNMKNFQKAAEGDEKALNELQASYVEALAGVDFGPELDALAAEVAAWDPGDLEVGATINDTDFLAKCAELVNKAGLTAEQASDALSAMGVDAKITPHEVTIGEGGSTTVEATGGIYVPKVSGDGTVSYEYAEAEGSYEIKGQPGETMTYYTIEGAKYNGKGVTGGGVGGRRGGGGGGRREARRANHTTAKPERYHKIDNTIDDLSDAYERLNKQKDRAWGADRVKAMKEELSLMKQQADAIKAKALEAEEYRKADLAKAMEEGWTFDADGNVSNYDEKWKQMQDAYNAKIDAYNAMSAEQQEAEDKKYKDMMNDEGQYYSGYEDYWQQNILTNPQEALEQYEETMELLEELGLEMADILNSQYDNVLEQIQYKLDLTLELTENELNIIDYKLKSIEDSAYRAGEALGLMTQKMDASKSNFNAYYTALDDLLKANNADWSADKLLSGEIGAKDLADAGLQSGDIEIIKTVMEGLRESTSAMTEQMVEGYETMTESFDSFNEELERYISTIEHAQNVTSTYKNILDLTGRSMSGFTSTMLKELNTLVVSQAQNKLTSSKTTLDTIKQEFQVAKDAYKQAQDDFANGKIDQAALDAAKDAYESAQDTLDEAEENFLTSWEETLQAAADAFESNIGEITRTIGEALSGGLAGGLAELEDQFAKVKEQDEMYVDDYEKIYQLTKLTRDLESKIDNTTNIRAQKEMLKLQKEINGLLESDKELSQYDIEYLQKKADLKLAEIAMQDAQNAKSQVMMRRDSEGNYNYVYTADEDAVEKAEQEYADKLYEMQVANDEYITTLQENMSALSSQMLNEIASIDRTVYDTEEKYQAEVERITTHYSTMMGYYNSEMKKVLDNNTILYNEDWTEFNKFTGYKISAAENYVTKWNQTMLSQITGFDTQEDYYANFNKTLFGDNPESPSSDSLIGQVLAAYSTMTQQIAAANEAAGLETGTLAGLIMGNIDAATDEAEAAAQNITTQAGLITTAIEGIGTAISTMAANYAEDFKTMSDATDVLNRRLSDFLTMAGSSQEFSIDAGVLSQIRARLDAEGFDTGGYTGAWGSEGKLAFLHQKELVLNAHDTANMLASVGILRQIANVIDLNALSSAGGFASLMQTGVHSNKETLQQEVHIEAHFPNATDKNQIEDAFKDIVNLAAQYANRSSF